jgi:alcohol dehydrogenase class IV
MRETWSFHSAGQLVFGPGAASQLGELAQNLGLKRILVVTDKGIVKAGLLESVRAPLLAAGIVVDVFDEGRPEPSLEVAEQCIAAGNYCEPHGVLGLGGGSNLDLAKITSAVLTHGGKPRDYIGEFKVPGPVLPLICVPTTSGTGSEVTAASVLTDTENKMKVGVLSNYLRPRLAVVDPRLTLTCPRKVTADSGIDALTHAIEAYTAIDNAEFPLPPGERTVYQGHHPMGDCLAEKAIELVGRHLVQAVTHPSDLAAREGMALGATIAGLAFSNVGVALVHAMEYPVGGAVHCSHGEGNGLLLPYVMRYNLSACPARMARIAQLLGQDLTGLDEAQAADRAIVAVEQLKQAVGIPSRLRELGVTREQLRPFAERAFGVKRILRVNPRPVTVDEIEKIFESAW